MAPVVACGEALLDADSERLGAPEVLAAYGAGMTLKQLAASYEPSYGRV